MSSNVGTAPSKPSHRISRNLAIALALAIIGIILLIGSFIPLTYTELVSVPTTMVSITTTTNSYEEHSTTLGYGIEYTCTVDHVDAGSRVKISIGLYGGPINVRVEDAYGTNLYSGRLSKSDVLVIYPSVSGSLKIIFEHNTLDVDERDSYSLSADESTSRRVYLVKGMSVAIYVTASGPLNDDLYLVIYTPSGGTLINTKFVKSFSQTFTADETGAYQIVFKNPSSFFDRSGYYAIVASALRTISVKADVEKAITTTIYGISTTPLTRTYTMSYLAPIGIALIVASAILPLIKRPKKMTFPQPSPSQRL